MKHIWEICMCGHDRKDHKNKLCIYRDREDKTCTGWKVDEKTTQEIEAMVADFNSAFRISKVTNAKFTVKQISDDKTADEIAKRLDVVPQSVPFPRREKS